MQQTSGHYVRLTSPSIFTSASPMLLTQTKPNMQRAICAVSVLWAQSKELVGDVVPNHHHEQFSVSDGAP